MHEQIGEIGLENRTCVSESILSIIQDHMRISEHQGTHTSPEHEAYLFANSSKRKQSLKNIKLGMVSSYGC